MTAEDVIARIREERDRIVAINKIEHPEYDHYINGWDDCISFLEDHIEMLSSCS